MGATKLRMYVREIDELNNDVEEKVAEAKTAKSALQAKWKEFKKEGGKSEVLRDALRMRTMEESDRIQYEHDRQRYLSFLRLSVGTQTSLLPDADDQPTEPGNGAPPAAAELATPPKRGRSAAALATTENATGSPLN